MKFVTENRKALTFTEQDDRTSEEITLNVLYAYKLHIALSLQTFADIIIIVVAA